MSQLSLPIVVNLGDNGKFKEPSWLHRNALPINAIFDVPLLIQNKQNSNSVWNC